MDGVSHQGRILVVDNYEDWRKTLRRILVSEGFEVQVAQSRQEALGYLHSQPFDLIILDVVLEGSRPQTYDGLKLLQEIEPICAREGTRVVIVSGFDCPEELQEQLQRSCLVATLNKRMIEADALVSLVQRGVEQAQQLRHSTSAQATVHNTTES